MKGLYFKRYKNGVTEGLVWLNTEKVLRYGCGGFSKESIGYVKLLRIDFKGEELL